MVIKSEKTNDKNEKSVKKTFKEQDQERMDYVNQATREVMASVDSFNGFLAVQSHFERYSLNNNLLIAAQRPDATRLKSMKLWNEEKKSIKKGHTAVYIYEPEQRQSGDKTYVNYKRKSMFDISDVENATPEQKPAYDVAKLIEAVASEKTVEVITLEDYPQNRSAGMFYSEEDKCIYAKTGMSNIEIFSSLTMALAHAEMAKNEENYIAGDHAFEAKCVANILCRKYSLPISFVNISAIPENYLGISEKDVRSKLSPINLCVKKLSRDIYHAMVKGNEVKEAEKESDRGDDR